MSNKELWRRNTKDHGMSSLKGPRSSSLYLFMLGKVLQKFVLNLKICEICSFAKAGIVLMLLNFE